MKIKLCEDNWCHTQKDTSIVYWRTVSCFPDLMRITPDCLCWPGRSLKVLSLLSRAFHKHGFDMFLMNHMLQCIITCGSSWYGCCALLALFPAFLNRHKLWFSYVIFKCNIIFPSQSPIAIILCFVVIVAGWLVCEVVKTGKSKKIKMLPPQKKC